MQVVAVALHILEPLVLVVLVAVEMEEEKVQVHRLRQELII
jgi:hypothetical protein